MDKATKPNIPSTRQTIERTMMKYGTNEVRQSVRPQKHKEILAELWLGEVGALGDFPEVRDVAATISCIKW